MHVIGGASFPPTDTQHIPSIVYYFSPPTSQPLLKDKWYLIYSLNSSLVYDEFFFSPLSVSIHSRACHLVCELK